jgi:hypothetical protein
MGIGFGIANAGMAYATGGNVAAAFAGGFVEGFLSPVAPVAGGIAGGFLQCMLEDGEIDDMDLVLIGMAAVPGPNFGGQGGRAARNFFRSSGGELPEELLEIEGRLIVHKNQAVSDVGGKLSKAQMDDIEKKGGIGTLRGNNAYRRHIGTNIDIKFKKLVSDDSSLKGIVSTECRENGRFISRPDAYLIDKDLISRHGNYWWDVTTAKSWQSHLGRGYIGTGRLLEYGI